MNIRENLDMLTFGYHVRWFISSILFGFSPFIIMYSLWALTGFKQYGGGDNPFVGIGFAIIGTIPMAAISLVTQCAVLIVQLIYVLINKTRGE